MIGLSKRHGKDKPSTWDSDRLWHSPFHGTTFAFFHPSRQPFLESSVPSLNMPLVAKWALYAALTVVIGAMLYPRFFPSLVREGQVAPPLIVQLDRGEHFELSQARGKPLVLNFWGTYCGPCQQEAPMLSRVHARLHRRGGMVIGIAVDNMPLAKVVHIARSLGMTYPIALASQEDMLRYKVTTIPTTYVVDAQGMIQDATVGVVSERRLERVLKSTFMR